MPIQYLQKKIPPVKNNYIVVGEDGYLTTKSELPSGLLPTINIITNSNLINIKAVCQDASSEIIKIDNNLYKCNVSYFGYWYIYATNKMTQKIVSDIVLIEEIKEYEINLTQSN